jgi:peptidoglycan/LPS O-acetylase OafA/YrhL
MDRTPPPQSLRSGDAQNPGGFAHIAALDGVRGLAILLVLYCHLFSANPITGSRIFSFLSELRVSSYIGVDLFFALSGFLITGILLDTLHLPDFFKNFYARRTLRIFPLYYGVLFVLLLLTRPLHFVWSGWQYFYLTYTSNLALWRSQPLILPNFNITHFWSLQVEEQFYLVWPFLVYRVKRAQSLIKISLIACLVILLIRVVLVSLRSHFQKIYLPYTPTFSCADNLLYGCCLCALLRTSARQRVLELAPRVLAFCAAILLCAAFFYHGLVWETNFFVPTLGFSLVGISSAALIAMTLRPNSKTQRLFQNKTLRFFGKYSYGLYVFHYSLEAMLTQRVRLVVDSHFHSKALGVLAGACTVLIASILVSLLSFHFYEARFLRLKKYFSYNRRVQPTLEPQMSTY